MPGIQYLTRKYSMKKLQETLAGKKTYLVAFGLIAYAVLGVVMGQMTLEQATQVVLNGLGLAALRSGVAKVQG